MFAKPLYLRLVTPVGFSLLLCWINACHFSRPTSYVASPELGYIGAIQSEFSIGANGEATLVFPMDVIPGTKGIQPSLSLHYNSKGGNGMAGMGMKLDGLSVIERVGATPVQDGFWGAVNYDSNDRFSIDGQRLMVVNGTYGADGSEYHTQLESWANVEAVGDCGSGPCSFKVWQKEGTLYEYGATDDARIEATGKSDVRVWALNKVTDLHGNTITISYTEEDGSYYPLTIAYTENSSAGLSAGRFVDFSYETRNDTVPGFEGGAGFNVTKRLTNVDIRRENSVVRTYHLNYAYEVATGRSTVTKVWECDSNNQCLPATELTWTQGDTNLLNAADSLSPVIENRELFTLDINADGRTDMVSVQTTNNDEFEIETWLSNGTDFYSTGSFTMPDIERNGHVLPGDVDGDGRTDLVYALSENDDLKAYTFLSDGTTLFPADTFYAPASYPTDGSTAYLLDVNGDSRSDIVCAILPDYAHQQITLSSFLSIGSTFQADTSQIIPLTDSEEGGALFAMDINADNLTDFAWVTSGSGTSDLLIRPLFSRVSYFESDTLQAFPFFGGSGGTVIPMDVNGDFKLDIVYTGSTFNDTLKLTTFLSNGQDFELGIQQTGAQGHSTDRGNLVPADMNGDGQQDLLLVDTDAGAPYLVTAYLSRGDGFNSPQGLLQTTGSTDGVPIPVDLDGDALYDLMYAVLEQGLSDYEYHFSIYRSPQSYPCLLSSINNNIGGSVVITYKPLTDTTVYSESAVADTDYLPASCQVSTANGATYPISTTSTSIAGTDYPIVDVDMPVYAVSDYRKKSNRGDDYAYSFYYSGAKMDRGGYGWLGFESKSVSDTSLNTIGVTYYHQEFPLIGMIDHTTAYRLSDSSRLNRVRKSYDIDYPLAGDTTIAQPLEIKVAKDLYTYGTWDLTLIMEYAYDSFANPTLITNIGDSAAPNILYTITGYDNDVNDWQLGYTTSAKESSTATGDTADLFSWEQYDYDNARNVVRNRSYNSQLDAFVTTSASYDAVGNAVATVSAAGDTTTFEYDSDYLTFQVQSSSPVNAWGNRLKDTYTYDYSFGEITSHTGPNGVTNYYTYDGIGRQHKVYGPDPQGDTTLLLTNSWVATGDSGYYQETQTRLEWDDDQFPWARTYTDGLLHNYQYTSVGATFSQERVSQRWYDSRGRVIKETSPYWQGSDTIVYATTTYDPYGRIVRSRAPKDDADSIITVYDFPTRTHVVVTEASGTADEAEIHVLQEYYASSAKMAVRVNELGDSTHYGYDLPGRPLTITDPKGILTEVAYNTHSRKEQSVSNGLGTTQYYYFDSLSYNLHVNTNNDTITTRFDALGREAVRKVSPTDSFRFQYDDPSVNNGQGKLTSVFMPDGNSYRISYDEYGNKDSIIFHLAGTDYVTTHSYDPNHRLDQVMWPDGSVQRFAWRLDGYLDTLIVENASAGTTGSETAFAQYANYNALGHATQINYGNGVTGDFDYFNNGLMDTLKLTGSGNSNILHQVFARDYRNRLTEVENLDTASSDWSQTFEYDDAGQLTRAMGGYGERSYGFDPSGNMVSKDSVTWDYDAYQVQYGMTGNDTAAAYHYDEMGNVAQKRADGNTMDFDYDQLQQLKTFTINDTLAYSFAYDYLGRRMSKADSVNKTTTYYVSPTYELTVYHETSDSLFTKYVNSGGGRIASITDSASSVQLVRPGEPVQDGSFFGPWWPDTLWQWQRAFGMATGLSVLAFFFLLLARRIGQRNQCWTHVGAGWLRDVMATLAFGALLTMSVGLPVNAQAAATAGEDGLPETGVLYFHQDYVNSIQLVTDISGDVSARVHYLPYGEIAEQDGDNNFRYKFGGKELDQLSGLHYFASRYYDTQSGRFMTSDTQLGGAVNQSFASNQYAYVLNNPVNYIDPSGHNVWSWFKHHSKQFEAIAISTAEIVAGVALIVDSEGSSSTTGMALINAGIEGIVYTITHFNNFQWSEYGIASGKGFVTGLGSSNEAEDPTNSEGSVAGEDASKSSVKTGCFVAGTLVATEDGLRPIEAIKTGDRVWSFNETTGEEELNEVVQLFRPKTERLVRITVGDNTIEATPEHPFWVEGTWRRADDLKPGDVLRNLAGNALVVDMVSVRHRPCEVYNFEVAKAHTYYVAEGKVLVHNICSKKRRGPIRKSRRLSEMNGEVMTRSGRTPSKVTRFDPTETRAKPRVFRKGGHPFLKCPRGSYMEKVEIEYTGSRQTDFAEANRAMRQKKPDWRQPKNTVWHHYHDYNATDNTGSMYLLRTSEHQPFHYGGVWQAKYTPRFGGEYGMLWDSNGTSSSLVMVGRILSIKPPRRQEVGDRFPERTRMI